MPLYDLHPDQRLSYVLLDGEPDRPWLIFLHHGLGSVGQWQDFPLRLCQRTGCPALLYDRIGHGQSSPLVSPRTREYLHDQALVALPQLIEHLLPDRDYLLVGHAEGGSIALIHGTQRPPRLRGIVTEGALVRVDPTSLEDARATEAAISPTRMIGLTRYHGDKTDALVQAWIHTWFSPTFADWTIEALLPQLEIPLLVIQGRDDSCGSEAQMEAIVTQVSGTATPLLLEDCGHAPHEDLPPLALDLMACFVNRVAR